MPGCCGRLDFLNVAMLASVIAVYGLKDAASAGAGLSALEVGVLYAFIGYIGRVVEPLIQITMQFSQLQQSVVAAARVNTLLKEPEAAEPGGDGWSATARWRCATCISATPRASRCCTG